MKKAMITGITGQDGSYLAELLLEKGYELVTVSEMFGFDPPETSEELYVFDRKNYEDE